MIIYVRRNCKGRADLFPKFTCLLSGLRSPVNARPFLPLKSHVISLTRVLRKPHSNSLKND